MQAQLSPYLRLPNGLRARLLLVFSKYFATLFHPLSFNVLREALSYLPDVAVLPCLSDKSLSLFYLPSGPEVTVPLDYSFPKFSQCCLLSVTEVLLFPNQRTEVWLIRLTSRRTTQMPALHLARDWPGIVAYNSHIYVFCGFNERSNERLDTLSSWTSISHSQYHHFQVNPCPVHTRIFLCDNRAWGYQVEIYDLPSDSFAMEVGVYFQLSGVVMLAEQETLLWVSCQGDVVVKPQGGNGKMRENQGKMYKLPLLCPVKFETSFYWREMGGAVQSLPICIAD